MVLRLLLYSPAVFSARRRKCFPKVCVALKTTLGLFQYYMHEGMHPTIIAEAFIKASAKAVEYLTEISMPVDLRDQASLLRAASTSLNSKVCVSSS